MRKSGGKERERCRRRAFQNPGHIQIVLNPPSIPLSPSPPLPCLGSASQATAGSSTGPFPVRPPVLLLPFPSCQLGLRSLAGVEQRHSGSGPRREGGTRLPKDEGNRVRGGRTGDSAHSVPVRFGPRASRSDVNHGGFPTPSEGAERVRRNNMSFSRRFYPKRLTVD